jgi:hypothetical protein
MNTDSMLTPSYLGVVASHTEVQLVVQIEESDQYEIVGTLSASQARLMAELLVAAADEIDRHPQEMH